MFETGFIIGLLALLTWLVVRALRQIRQTKPEFFVPAYLATIALKLLLSLAMLVVVLAHNPEKARINALVFLVGYVLATTVEVAVLWRKS